MTKRVEESSWCITATFDDYLSNIKHESRNSLSCSLSFFLSSPLTHLLPHCLFVPQYRPLFPLSSPFLVLQKGSELILVVATYSQCSKLFSESRAHIFLYIFFAPPPHQWHSSAFFFFYCASFIAHPYVCGLTCG